MRHGSQKLSKAMASAFRDSRQSEQLSVEPHSASVPADEIAHHHFPPLNAARASFQDAWQEVRSQQQQLHTESTALAAALQTQLQRMQISHAQHGRAREALNMHLPQLLEGVQGCLKSSEGLHPQLLQVQQQLQDAQVALKVWHMSQRARPRAESAQHAMSTPPSPPPARADAPNKPSPESPLAAAAVDDAASDAVGHTEAQGAVSASASAQTAAPAAAGQSLEEGGQADQPEASTEGARALDHSAEAPPAPTTTPSPAGTEGQAAQADATSAAAADTDAGETGETSGKRKKKRKGGKRKG